MDLDGRMEFIVKGFTVPDYKFQVFIFEATGNNAYQIKKEFIFKGNGQSYSASGDIDGDSIPEALLMTRPWIRILKARGNDDFYVWDSIYVKYNGSIAVYDIDGNGINDIIFSGKDTTWIYEWDGVYVREKPEVVLKNFKIRTFISRIDRRNYEVFNISGRRVNRLRKGIYFIKTKGRTFKIIKIR